MTIEVSLWYSPFVSLYFVQARKTSLRQASVSTVRFVCSHLTKLLWLIMSVNKCVRRNGVRERVFDNDVNVADYSS